MDIQRNNTAQSPLVIAQASAKIIDISIIGDLDIHTISSFWKELVPLQTRLKPEKFICDAKHIKHCDSAGAILILELQQAQEKIGKKFLLQNVSDELRELLQFLATQKKLLPAKEKSQMGFIESIGLGVVNVCKDLRDNIVFIGELLSYLFRFLFCPGCIRWQDFWRALEDVGPRALPIVFLIGFLVGVIITFQSAAPFGKFGAQLYIIDLVGLGLVREMGPLMTAILLSGRTASAFAAEIGAMKINQEIDALTTMGIEPVRFLTVPRILASIIMTPLLSMFLIVSGLLGCFAVMSSLGYNLHIFNQELISIIDLSDFVSGLLKTFVFGIIIASIGCLHGIRTNLGASAVGISTTKAVVSSLIMLVVVDGVFAIIYYALGI